jgi:hypothetical protein
MKIKSYFTLTKLSLAFWIIIPLFANNSRILRHHQRATVCASSPAFVSCPQYTEHSLQTICTHLENILRIKISPVSFIFRKWKSILFSIKRKQNESHELSLLVIYMDITYELNILQKAYFRTSPFCIRPIRRLRRIGPASPASAWSDTRVLERFLCSTQRF